MDMLRLNRTWYSLGNMYYKKIKIYVGEEVSCNGQVEQVNLILIGFQYNTL